MNWWHGSSPLTKDRRSGRQPQNPDANIFRRAPEWFPAATEIPERWR
jgi:hypothetical protein